MAMIHMVLGVPILFSVAAACAGALECRGWATSVFGFIPSLSPVKFR